MLKGKLSCCGYHQKHVIVRWIIFSWMPQTVTQKFDFKALRGNLQIILDSTNNGLISVRQLDRGEALTWGQGYLFFLLCLLSCLISLGTSQESQLQ